MSTADVRIDGSPEEKQATSQAGDADVPADARAETGGARGESGETRTRGAADAADTAGEDEEAGAWDDGLIARRARAGAGHGDRQSWSRAAALWGVESGDDGGAGETAWEFPGDAAAQPERQRTDSPSRDSSQGPLTRGKSGDQHPTDQPLPEWPAIDVSSAQGVRVAALRRLVDLSRSRIPGHVLAEAQRVLDAAGARERLPRAYTAVAIAGATGSGKSSLFNALAGTRLSQTGMRRPTTSTPVACSWEVPGAGPVDGILDRLSIPPSTRRLMRPESDWRGRIDSAARSELEGLVLIDLPDHDSAVKGHRKQVDRLLRLVDAVVWVLDPEKYADAVLHERYLRPLAGYAEVTFIVLNQTDRLPGDAADAVLNDLRRLLDDDGMALGEHGEPGARVMATSALVGEGIDELRTELSAFVADRSAAGLRLSADLDGVVERLRPVYATTGPGSAASSPAGLTEEVREGFADQLACAAGAVTAGQAAERAWLRHARRACGTPWAQLQHWYEERRAGSGTGVAAGAPGSEAFEVPAQDGVPYGDSGSDSPAGDAVGEPAATAGDVAAYPRVARPAVAHAVRTVVDQAAAGLPEAWRRSVRDAAWRGAAGLPEALDEALRGEADNGGAGNDVSSRDDGGSVDGTEAPQIRRDGVKGARGRAAKSAPVPPRPVWWALALVGQLGLLALQLLGAVWVLATALGVSFGDEWMGVALLTGGMGSGALLSWGCRFAARAPAAAYGRREELRLRRIVAACGQVRVLEPVAAELLRYREVREQYVVAAGEASHL